MFSPYGAVSNGSKTFQSFQSFKELKPVSDQESYNLPLV